MCSGSACVRPATGNSASDWYARAAHRVDSRSLHDGPCRSFGSEGRVHAACRITSDNFAQSRHRAVSASGATLERNDQHVAAAALRSPAIPNDPPPRIRRSAAAAARRDAGRQRRRFLGAPAAALGRRRRQARDSLQRDRQSHNRRLAEELARVGQKVGRKGQTRQRVVARQPPGRVGRAWSTRSTA